MKFLIVILAVATLPYFALGQFKTRQPVASGNLVAYHNATDYRYNASSYPALAQPTLGPSRPVAQPVFVDRTAEFLNKTRSGMASGVCFTEVPTASLVKNPNAGVPAGNGSTSGMSRIQICCEGYERNPYVFKKCDPICKDDCPNGICTAPNTCVCLPGNVRDYEDKCVPTCPIGCRNGMCKADGSCTCKPGFTLDLITRQFCRPHCSKGCDFGTCVAPDTCKCMPGYQLSSFGVCQPKCDNCEHGSCTVPGVCMCDRGYVRKGLVCEPICDRECIRGTCVGPNKCACKPGLVLDNTGFNCTPHCDKPCLNGYCNGYNDCACNIGYVKDDAQPNMCKPHCPLGCPNGYCTAPNFCLCKQGYIKSGVKGRQSCVPL